MTRRILISIALLVALVPASGAFAAPDDTATLAPGDTYEFSASLPVGLNPNYFPWAPDADAIFPVGQCSKNPNYYCDVFLFNFTNPMTQEQIDSGLTFVRRTATVTVDNYTVPAADYDLRAFESDADGTYGSMIGESGNSPGAAESMSLSLRSTPEKGDHWVLVEVGYWAGVGDYSGLVRF